MHRDYGMFAFAPYVDKWGEIDPAYRSTALLNLSQKRYDSTLRQHWLQKGLESMVARKLEVDNNQGGWETL
jgi:E3 ubiquitin-protein ligase UBR1